MIIASLAAMLSASAAGYDFEYQGLYFRTLENGRECELVRNPEVVYTGSVTIPAEAVDGGTTLNVTAIADTAFVNSTVSSLTVPSSIRSIGKRAFSGCSHLNVLNISDLSSWCNIAFADAYANPFAAQFYGSQKLTVGGEETTAIAIPADITAVRPYAFYRWECIKSLTIPDNVTEIGAEAFAQCKYISSIDVGSGLRSVGSGAFSVCEWLKTVSISSLADWCSINFASPASNPLSGDRIERLVTPEGDITALTIADGIESVGRYAFYNCRLIESVTIGDCVSTIGDQAFWGCENLTEVTLGNGLTSLPVGIFMNCKRLTAVDFGSSVATIGESAFSNCSALAELNLPASLRSIGQTSFSFLTSLTRLTVPEGTERIGQGAFSWCSALNDVSLPSSLSSVGFAAFSFCNALSDVTVDRSLAPEAPSTNPPFSSTAYASATLSIPAGSADSYRSAPGWSKFVNIKEFGQSAISGVSVDSPTVSVSGRTITIGGIGQDTPWTIIDMAGRTVSSGRGQAAINQAAGIYAVKIGALVQKIVLR